MRVFRSVQPEPSSPLDLAYSGPTTTTTAYQSPCFGYPKSPCYYNDMQLMGHITTFNTNQPHFNQTTPWIVPTQRDQVPNYYAPSQLLLNERFAYQFNSPVYLPNIMHIPNGGTLAGTTAQKIELPPYSMPSIQPSSNPCTKSNTSPIRTVTHILSYEEMIVDSLKHLQHLAEQRNQEFRGASINEIISDISSKHGHTLPVRYRECACVSLKRAFKKGIFVRKFGGVYSINPQYKGNIAKGRRKVTAGSERVRSYSFHCHPKVERHSSVHPFNPHIP